MVNNDDIYYVNLVKKGNTNAFVHIVRRYEKMVLTIITKIVNQRVEAEDIAQEIFIKVFQSLDKFREESEFATWLYRITYNTAISELRKRKYEFTSINDNFEHISNIEIYDSIEETTYEQRMEYLDLAIKKLSPDDALIISMFYLNNQSIQQISEVTNNSVSNIKVKLHRIRKLMNFEINKLLEK